MKKRARSIRRVLVKIDPDSFSLFLKKGSYAVESQIPKDAKFISVNHDPYSNCFLLCFEHWSFKAIPVGERLPVLEDIKIINLGE